MPQDTHSTTNRLLLALLFAIAFVAIGRGVPLLL